MLAEKESYVGHFYFVREQYDSALKRYEGLLAKYPNVGYDEESLYMAGLSAFESNNNEVGKKHMNDLVTRFPKGDWLGKAKSALEKYGSR